MEMCIRDRLFAASIKVCEKPPKSKIDQAGDFLGIVRKTITGALNNLSWAWSVSYTHLLARNNV